MSLRRLVISAAGAALSLTNWAAAAGPAEFAFRWEVVKGGPSSAAEVAAALQLKPGKAKAYQVLYFDVTQPGPAPAGYKALGRERGPSGGKPDATYKVRGLEPVPPELLNWKCPFAGASESKAEVDVGFQSLSQFKRSFSVSCTLDKKGLKVSLPAGYSAVTNGCASTMERTKAESATLEVKVERWSLPKARVVIEVSMAGSDSKPDFERFRDKVVKPLLDRKAVPLEESKTELGSDC
jgi:hypothetical protein